MYYLCDRAKLSEAYKWLDHPAIVGLELQGFANSLKTKAYVETLRQHQEFMSFEKSVAHGPYAGLSAGHPEFLIREITRQRIEEFVASASSFGVRRFVLHLNFCPETDRPINWCKRFVSWFRSFLDGQAADVVFFLENSLETNPEVLRNAVGEIDDPRIKLCLDLGHLHCNGCDCQHWLEVLQPWVGYFHVHDNHGLTENPFYERDEHLAAGEGTFPWPLFVELYMRLYSGIPLAIETHTAGWGASVLYLDRLFVPNGDPGR